MNKENLNGTLVLVKPEPELDTGQDKGHIGVLTYARSKEENYVQYPEGGQAFYHADQVMKLKDKQQVFNDLTKNGSDMPVGDFKAMYKIMLLQDRGTSQALFSALAIARDHPGVQDRVLESINPERKIDLDQAVSR